MNIALSIKVKSNTSSLKCYFERELYFKSYSDLEKFPFSETVETFSSLFASIPVIIIFETTLIHE